MPKYKFTKTVFDEICSLLRRRPTETRDEQKKTRARIRKLGFRISDYYNGFTDLDLKKLFEKGEVEIITDYNIVTKPAIKKAITKTTIFTKSSISKKG